MVDVCPICGNALGREVVKGEKKIYYIPSQKQPFLDDGRVLSLGVHKDCYLQKIGDVIKDKKRRNAIIEGFYQYNRRLDSMESTTDYINEYLKTHKASDLLDSSDDTDIQKLIDLMSED